MTILTYIVTAATMIGTIANSLQKRWCFYVWAVTNTFWMIYNMTIGQYAQGLILPEPDPVRGRAGAVEAQGRAVAVFPPYRAIYADRHKRIPIKAKDNLHTAF